MTRAATGMFGVVAGFLVIWSVLDQSAALLESYRGEAGLLVCAIVLIVAIGVQRILFGMAPGQALRDLGLRMPAARGTVAALVVSAAMLAFFPLFAVMTGTPMVVRSDWYWLLPGLFAQAGIAEETTFRGYLFWHLRKGRTFWRAAMAAAVPFVAVHTLLFVTLEPAVAATSLALAVSMAFPLSWLFERSGSSVWPPALVHFTVQGAVKLIEVPDDRMAAMAVLWMAAAAIVPWSLFLILRPQAPPWVAAEQGPAASGGNIDAAS